MLSMDGQNLIEEDDKETTETARQLVEDCRRMLLGKVIGFIYLGIVFKI